ncbi:unnamed protein product [Acanthoscelides obtectus]|uniref:Uncharacterized protein n=1 Tax=Acanthoscelides obtectus TaxID=200917 RepID=A0A9P0P668_ACAOB|nr:unnamed protein product [Acanthoscelides obtectus]CAK1625596.1 hypothetical protein AOBTE_LOCUS3257 [Acanthoscelides obtectus]
MTRRKKKDEDETVNISCDSIMSTQGTCEYLKNQNKLLQQELLEKTEDLENCQALLLEKETLIYHLSNENRRFQEQYDLISSNIVDRDCIVTPLETLLRRIEKLEETTRKNSTYAQAVINSPSKSKERTLKSLIITPEQQQSNYRTTELRTS